MLNKRIDTIQNDIDNARRQIRAGRIDEESCFSLSELFELVELWESELEALYNRGFYGASQAQYVVRRCN